MTIKMKFALNMHTQIFNTVCSQYNRISKSVLISQMLATIQSRTFCLLVCCLET
jgi:hypothetical protein